MLIDNFFASDSFLYYTGQIDNFIVSAAFPVLIIQFIIQFCHIAKVKLHILTERARGLGSHRQLSIYAFYLVLCLISPYPKYLGGRIFLYF